MASSKADVEVEKAKKGAISSLMEWGKSPLPPMLLATLTTALHFRPFQPLPMIFPPALLFSTYLNLNGYEADAAGITAAWSGLYMLLAGRRKAVNLKSKFGVRGLVRGSAILLALANVAGGGTYYVFGKKSKVDDGNGFL